MPPSLFGAYSHFRLVYPYNKHRSFGVHYYFNTFLSLKEGVEPSSIMRA